MAPAICIEGAKQASLDDGIEDPLKAAGSTFLIGKEHGIVFVGGIVHGHNQVPFLARNPIVAATILMDHHPDKRRSFPAFAVHSSLGCLGKHTL